LSLESSKTLGGIGAFLLFAGGLSFFVQPFLMLGFGLVGAVLMLVSLRGLADIYKEKAVFTNGFYGFTAYVSAAVVAFAGFYYLFNYTSYVKNFVAVLYPGFNGDWTNLPNLTVNPNFNPADLVPFLVPVLAILIVVWVFLIVSAFFTWRSLKTVAAKSTVGLFSTAALLLLVGAIIPVFGLVLMWIAVLLMAIGFFQLKPAEQPSAVYTPPPTTV
jgi:uncharacterized membrane protein